LPNLKAYPPHRHRFEASILTYFLTDKVRRLHQRTEAEASQLRAESETKLYQERKKTAAVLQENPALLRLEELDTLRKLAQNANARIYIGVDKGGLKSEAQSE
jgi:hypothetical protein